MPKTRRFSPPACLTANRSSRIFPFEEKGVFKSLFPAQIPVKNNPQAGTRRQGRRVPVLVMHFGRPVPEMHSHDATGYWCRDSSCVRSVAPLRGAAQLLDGISAATLGVLVPLVIADTTRGSGHFNFAQGVVGVAVGIGASISTTLAGYIADASGSVAAFLFLAGVGAVGLALVLCSHARDARRAVGHLSGDYTALACAPAFSTFTLFVPPKSADGAPARPRLAMTAPPGVLPG